MKHIKLHAKHTAFIAAIAIASCSQGPVAPTNVRTEVIALPAGTDGSIRGAADGDVKNGPIEIDLVRVAQTDGVPFYAFANGEYIVGPEREVEVYVQIWTANPAVATTPRLLVDWGFGEADNIHCGPCRVSRTYRTEGRYTVTVTMDDRVGGVTSRTFVLDVRNVAPEE